MIKCIHEYKNNISFPKVSWEAYIVGSVMKKAQLYCFYHLESKPSHGESNKDVLFS